MVIGERLRFLHVPKCGGTWTQEALLNCGSDALHVPSAPGGGLQELCGAPGAGLFTFATVREPMSWYRSFWAYRRMTGWHVRQQPIDDFQCNHFTTWMRWCLDMHPGFLSRLYRRYVGVPGVTEIDFICRFERLVPDVIAAVEQSGEPNVSLARIAHTPPQCVAPPELKRLAEPTPELTDRLRHTEAAAYERFGW